MTFERFSTSSNSFLTSSLKLNGVDQSLSFDLDFDFALCHNYGCCGYRG